MPVLPLPINVGLNIDIDEAGLSTHRGQLLDVFVDPKGSIIRRPALVEFCDVGVSYGVDGLYWWDRQEKVIAVAGGRIFEITTSSGDYSEISGDTFELRNLVSWSDFGTSLYGANGGRIVKIPSSGDAAYVADAQAPTTVYKIATLDDYLLALEDGSQRVHYSDASDPDSWSGAWITAVINPDLLKALGAVGDIIELVGTKLWEGWRNDGSTPFLKESQYTIRRGISAPDSFLFIEDTWYWIDEERKVLRLNGRSPEIISLSLNRYLQEFDVVSDAIGGYTNFDGRPQYVLTFPSDEKTIAIDVYSKIWTELSWWKANIAEHKQFLGKSFCSATGWGKTLVGDRFTGKVYELDSTAYQDNGYDMRPVVRTPTIDRDFPSLTKRVKRLELYFKKTESPSSGTGGDIIVRWRDNGSTEWKSQRIISLGEIGKTDFKLSLTRLGRYKTRQYEFILTHNAPIAFIRADEHFRVLDKEELSGK